MHYRGTRGRDAFDVIDNVIQELPLVGRAPVQKVAGDAEPRS